MVVVPGHFRVTVVHGPVPREITNALSSTPPVTAVANVVETTTAEAETARKSRKAKIVGAVSVAVPTACCF